MISRMKKFCLLFLLLLISSCQLRSTDHSSTEPPPKAVYLTYGQGELTARDLKAHPEVIVVRTFNDFKYHASQRMALWIDRNAAPLDAEQAKWINESPPAGNPIVLVGYSDPLYSFRDLLKLCCFLGPATTGQPEPGFSVLQWDAKFDPNARTIVFLQGYPEKPSVNSILRITNALLEGKIQPTTAITATPVATATNVP
jgi:hypothetical protein